MVIVFLLAKNSKLTYFGAGLGYRCSTYQSGDLTKTDKAVDGIFGFGPGDLSIISQLSSRGITPKVFSHCLKGDGNGGGILVLGEILEPGIVYTPLVPSQYVLVPRKLSFCSQFSMLPHSGLFEAGIVDIFRYMNSLDSCTKVIFTFK